MIKIIKLMLIMLFLLILNSFQFREEFEPKIKQGSFNYFKITDSKLKNLIDSLSNYIINCEKFSDGKMGVIEVYKNNDSEITVYISLIHRVHGLNTINGYYNSKKLNFIIYESDMFSKYFKIDSSKKKLIIESNVYPDEFKSPEWIFNIKKNSIILSDELYTSCD